MSYEKVIKKAHRNHPHLGSDGLLRVLKSRGNSIAESQSEVNQAINWLRAHPHLGPHEVVSLLPRANGPGTKDPDSDKDSPTLTRGFRRTRDED
jgi:hypothetical protein